MDETKLLQTPASNMKDINCDGPIHCMYYIERPLADDQYSDCYNLKQLI